MIAPSRATCAKETLPRVKLLCGLTLRDLDTNLAVRINMASFCSEGGK